MFKRIAGAMLVLAGIGIMAAPMATAKGKPDGPNPPSHREVVCHRTGNGFVVIPPAKASSHINGKGGHEGDVLLKETYPDDAKWPDLKASFQEKCDALVTPPTKTTTKTTSPTSSTTTSSTSTTTTSTTTTATSSSTTLVPSKSVTKSPVVKPPVKQTKTVAVVVPEPVVTTSKGVQRQFAAPRPAELAHTGAKTTAAIVGLVLLLAGLALLGMSKLTPRRH